MYELRERFDRCTDKMLGMS